MIKLVFKDIDGFDIGLMVWTWFRIGPIMVYREMESTVGNPPPLTGYKFAIFFRKSALEEFYEGSIK